MTALMSEADLREQFPDIAWDEPLRVTVPGIGNGLACRYCVAAFGLRGRDLSTLPRTRAEFDAHIEEFHARNE